jgi:mRNA interferase HigB
MRRFAVRIISRKKLREAYKVHPEWEASLVSWYRIVKAATWSNFADVKQSWKNVDFVGTSVVFDISHNKCRLIAFIGYRVHIVFILRVLSHADYLKEI